MLIPIPATQRLDKRLHSGYTSNISIGAKFMEKHLPTILLDGEPPANLRVVDVEGNALSSKVRSGDRAIIDVKDMSLREGYIACDFFNEGIIQLFRLQITFNVEKPYRLTNDDPHNIPQDLTREQLLDGLLGRVVGALIRIH